MPDQPTASTRGSIGRRRLLLAMAAGLLPQRVLRAAARVPQMVASSAIEDLTVTIDVDADKTLGELHPIWRYYGADEPNYSTMPNGQKLLAELGRIGPAPAHFRVHNLLTTGDGTPALKWGSTNAYTEDAEGNPVYDWTIVDAILESGLSRGVKPYVQIGFMPKALSIKPEPYQHHWPHGELFTGWAYPPKDYLRWGELAYQLTWHCVERYGREEAESWYWEVWNEPNIGYWKGTAQEFYELYDYAIDGVRRALPEARVGGPHCAGGPGGDFLHSFLEHCAGGTNYATGKTGAPLDFIAFHAKGAPQFVDGHVRMGIAHQLRDIDSAFQVIAGFPEFRDRPIVIGESDPDGCAACKGPQLGYRNGPLYASYTAASFARKVDLAARHGVRLDGAVTWAFEFENQPYFAGFRQLTSNGIPLPVLNTFRMFGHMSGQRVSVRSSSAVDLDAMMQNGVREAPDISALAARDVNRLTVMVWNYHDDDVPGPVAAVDLNVRGLPHKKGGATLSHYRIDEMYSNAYTAWLRMGSPQQPTAEQYTEMERASDLTPLTPPAPVVVNDGAASIHLQLPRQAVSLLVFEW